MRARGSRKTISPEEQTLLERLLRADDPNVVKSALQRICQVREDGRYFRDTQGIGDQLTTLLWSPHVQLRRWTYKAIALIDDPNRHFGPLLARVEQGEGDAENQTWAIGALFAIATPPNFEEMRERGLIPNEGAALLAAHLYNKPFSDLRVPESIDVDRADPLTLQWSSLLVGYDRAPENLFHPRIGNGQLMSKLNCHDDPLVAEYSVWGLHRNPDLGIDDLGFPLHEVAAKPENVRRWTDRLLTKNQAELATRLEVLAERSKDRAAKAREGLALGLVHLWIKGLDDIILPWFAQESSPLVRDLLTEHMAVNSDESQDYHELVFELYHRDGATALTRTRIIAASVGTSLYIDLRQLEVTRKYDAPLLDQGVLSVTQNFNTGGGPLSIGANMGSGTMKVDAHALVQQMSSASPDQRKALGEALDLAARLPKSAGEALSTDVEAYAKEPAPSKLAALTQRLKQIKDSTEYSRDIVVAASSLFTLIATLFT